MKVCLFCNLVTQDDVKVCSNCGHAEFGPLSQEELNNMQQAGVASSNVFISSTQEQAEPTVFVTMPSAMRHRKKLFAVGGICLSLIIIVVLALVGMAIAESKQYENHPDNYTSDVYEENIAFSVGSIQNNVYLNEWADLKFDLGDEWVEATADAYATYHDEYTVCGFYGMRTDGTLLANVYIDLSKLGEDVYFSEKELLDEYVSGIASGFENADISQTTYEMVGNQLYLCADVSGMISNNNMCLSAYGRIVDQHMILIIITGTDAQENHSIAEQIESY